MVESLTYYVRRIAWTTGISISRLTAYTGEVRTGVSSGHDRQNLLLGSPEDRIFRLELLTGVSHLRYGTFWVLKDIAGPRFLGHATHVRRWCPQCYAEWDTGSSYEPLLWEIGIQTCCPAHGCYLERQCASCKAMQPAGVSIDRRRRCMTCDSDLAVGRRSTLLSSDKAWIDQQVCQLIQLCSTVGQEPLEKGTFQSYVTGLLSQMKERDSVPAALQSALRLRAKRRAIKKPTLQTMIRMCALQGIPIRDLLLDPIKASSAPLIDMWTTHAPPLLVNDTQKESASLAVDLLTKLLHRCRYRYLPSMDVVLHDIHLDRATVRDIDVALYERYQSLYRQQAGPAANVRLAKVFRRILDTLNDLPLERLNRKMLWKIPESIASTSSISSDEASSLLLSALIYTRLKRRPSKRKSMS